MSSNDPVDPRVRLAIAQWPDDAPRGAVTSFCAEHGISRKTFYQLRNRARLDGPAAVLEPRSRRPATSPTRIRDEAKDQAVQVRASLEASGLDHGPISVFDKMCQMGLTPPSVPSLARIFRERGVARVQPNKKPRAAWRRFVYPAPNACWQLDATEYVLTRGRKCVIFQLEDDNSRVAVASHVAASETGQAALTVFNKGVAVRGVPQRLLTDNGLALNPTRRGWTNELVRHANSLGVETITGKPYKPTTQGKNERFHQTLFRWLHAQPIADSIEALQAQVDRFDDIYNNERPHQGLPGRTTPQAAWEATPLATPPRPPIIDNTPVAPTGQSANTAQTPQDRPQRRAAGRLLAPEGTGRRRVQLNGTISLRGTAFLVSYAHAGTEIHIDWDHTSVMFIDNDGVILAHHAWPPEGTTYVSKHAPDPRHGGRPRKKP